MDIIKLVINNHIILNLFVHQALILIIVLLIALAILSKFCFKKKISKGKLKINQTTIGTGSSEIVITRNYQVVQVAYKLWVELNTRKLGLQIDLDNDVISEIYKSWYKFFEITRELIKEIPAEDAQDKETQKLINIAMGVLNEAVRPHLTKWQARFNHWYNKYVEENKSNISPQEIQKEFNCAEYQNCYNDLTSDLLGVNNKLIEYKKILEEIIFEQEPNKFSQLFKKVKNIFSKKDK